MNVYGSMLDRIAARSPGEVAKLLAQLSGRKIEGWISRGLFKPSRPPEPDAKQSFTLRDLIRLTVARDMIGLGLTEDRALALVADEDEFFANRSELGRQFGSCQISVNVAQIRTLLFHACFAQRGPTPFDVTGAPRKLRRAA